MRIPDRLDDNGEQELLRAVEVIRPYLHNMAFASVPVPFVAQEADDEGEDQEDFDDGDEDDEEEGDEDLEEEEE